MGSFVDGTFAIAFKDRPVLKKVAGDLTTKVVSGLLGTDQAENAINEVVSRLNVLVTSNDPQPVVLDLSGVKDVVTQLVNISVEAGREPKVDPSNIPSQIVILDTDSLPNFYKASVAFLWLAPLAFLGAVAALAGPYFKRTRQLKPMLLTQGAVLTATGLLGLLIGPLFRPPLLSNVPTSQGRVVVGNIYDGFIATYNTQTWYLIAFGLAVTVFAGALYAYQVIAPAVKNYSQKRSTKSSTKK